MRLTPEQQASLTLKQKYGLYFPHRDKHGAVVIPSGDTVAPDRELTLAEELQQLDMLAGILGMQEKELAKAKRNLETKYSGEK